MIQIPIAAEVDLTTIDLQHTNQTLLPYSFTEVTISKDIDMMKIVTLIRYQMEVLSIVLLQQLRTHSVMLVLIKRTGLSFLGYLKTIIILL